MPAPLRIVVIPLQHMSMLGPSLLESQISHVSRSSRVQVKTTSKSTNGQSETRWDSETYLKDGIFSNRVPERRLPSYSSL